MEENPHSGIDGKTWRKAPIVTLQIDGGKGEIVEKRIEDGAKEEIIVISFAPASEADEQDVLDETRFG